MSTMTEVTVAESLDITTETHEIKPHITPPSTASSKVPDWHRDNKPSLDDWFGGLWFLVWWAYGFLRVYRIKWLPIPHHWGSLTARTRSNHRIMWRLSRWALGVFLNVAVNGGIGKTTTTTWAATNYARHTDCKVLIIDADSGSRGKAPIRMLIDMAKEKYHLNAVKRLILSEDWSPTCKELSACLPRHEETGALVLAPVDEIWLTAHQCEKMIEKLRPASGAVFIDTTPGTKEANTRGAQRQATIVSTVCLYESDDLAHNIATMRFTENQEDDRFEKRLADGTMFIVVGDVPWYKFNRRTQYELAHKLNAPAKQVVLLPRDKHIQRSRPVIWHAASRRFRYAISEYTRLLAEAAAQYNAAHPIAEPKGIDRPSNDQRNLKLAVAKLVGLAGSADAAAKQIWIENPDAIS